MPCKEPTANDVSQLPCIWWGGFCQKLLIYIFHIFLYRDEYGYILIQRKKIEAKLGYTQITPTIIVDP